VDHIFGNYYFRGAGIVVAHAETAANFMVVTPEINPYETSPICSSFTSPVIVPCALPLRFRFHPRSCPAGC
jgi:hypothetical protein